MLPLRRLFLYLEKAVPKNDDLRKVFMVSPNEKTGHSLLLIVQPYQRICWKVSCLVIPKRPLPVLAKAVSRGCSNSRTVAACFWTESDIYLWIFRRNFCGQFRRVGGKKLVQVDVLRLDIPPLVERKEDIPLLAAGILNRVSDITPKQKRAIVATLSICSNYDWPGNIRELENIVRRLAVLTNGLSEPEARAVARQALHRVFGGNVRYLPQKNIHLTLHLSVDQQLKQLVAKAEKEIIQQMVLLCGGDRRQAARKLGIGRTTLWRKSTENQGDDDELDL